MFDNFSSQTTSSEQSKKIFISLVNHVYSQSNIAMVASLICGTIVFVGLFSLRGDNSVLLAWFAFYLFITVMRVMLINMYEASPFTEKRIQLWCYLYIVGALLGGISWGLPAVLFLHHVSGIQQTLMILLTAGVTAGAIPMSAAIPSATISFLICSITPYIISIGFLRQPIYLLFDVALSFYLFYTIVLTMSTYRVIKNSIILTFENDALLNNLVKAKKELEIINKKLELSASHDSLTNVPNRSLFEKNLTEALIRAKQSGTMLALLYFDFDNFKPMNDKFGHYAGDLILLKSIEKLKEFFNDDDIIARCGGDEFTIILENIESVETVASIAQQICQLMAKPIKLKNMTLEVTASIGIALYPFDASDADTLIKVADKTMYYVKDHGGNNFYFYKNLIALGE